MNVRVHSDRVRGVAGCARSLYNNNLGEAAGQAIGAGLQHTPQLQKLEEVPTPLARRLTGGRGCVRRRRVQLHGLCIRGA